MLILVGTTDKLQLVTGSATNVDVVASWVDSTGVSGSNVTPGCTPTAVSTATTTDIVATPASSTFRNIKQLTVRNKDTTNPNTVTVVLNRSATAYELHKTTLNAGECLEYTEGVGFFVLTAQVQNVDVQTFTTTGANTWTKPTVFTPKAVIAKLWAAGGGGGAGASLATATIAKGGAGGGGGAFVRESYNAADLGATVTVTVGAGGSAGTPGAAGAAGGDGGIGGNTSFGTLLVAYGGGGGRGGAISGVASGGGGGGGTGGAGTTGSTAVGQGGFPGPVGAKGVTGVWGGTGSDGVITVVTTHNAEYGGGGGGGSTATPTSAVGGS